MCAWVERINLQLYCDFGQWDEFRHLSQANNLDSQIVWARPGPDLTVTGTGKTMLNTHVIPQE